MSDIVEKIARNIRYYRTSIKGWTLNELAKNAGMSRTIIDYMENKRLKDPSVVKCKKIADALEISVNNLINEAEPEIPASVYRLTKKISALDERKMLLLEKIIESWE